MKPTLKTVLYKKWQKERQLLVMQSTREREQIKTNRQSAKESQRRYPDDNRSEIPSLYEDNQSLRYSNHDNI